MSVSGGGRTGLIIITDIYKLTREMTGKLREPGFLIEAVEKRQKLMDEYDAYKAAHPDEDTAELRDMAKDMSAMDKKISAALSRHRNEARNQLAQYRDRQKVAEYASNYMSSSGTYMNLKK